MTVGSIEELHIVDVYDHGIPNRERVAIYVKGFCDLSDYCMLLGLTGVDGTPVPIRDHLLWFGHGFVNPGDWVFVYTADGATTITNFVPESNPSAINRMVSVHWGKEHTVFQNRGVVPVLIRMDGVTTTPAPTAQYQGLPESNKFLR